MVFSKGLLFLVIRVTVLAMLILAVTYSYLSTDLLITPIMFGLLSLISLAELIWFLQQQERNWIRFLESIKYQDFNRVYQNKASKQLANAYEMITQQMEELASANQAEYQMLQTVLRHISIGLACYKKDGTIVFTNKSFDDILGLQALIHMDKLKSSYPALYQIMVTPNQQSSGWIDHKDGQKLLVRTEPFKLKQISYTLVSLTDIRNTLDTKELESYQRLMRVMTHEIMNSANPILSLIKVVNKKLITDEQLATLSVKDQKNIVISLNAIEERTSGILRFVSAYKEISKPITLRLETVHSAEFLTGLAQLVAADSRASLTVSDYVDDLITLDATLMKQVLINLLKNANDAVEHKANGRIEVTLKRLGKELVLSVADNGEGVNVEDASQIFIPFYTTKPDGSGIGLALSRKIVKAHGGFLEYKSEKERTVFVIRLPS